MGKSLSEYAEQHPQARPDLEAEKMAAQARSLDDLKHNRAQAAELQESITTQLEEGNAPELILYTAIKCIGLLTNAPEWAQAAERRLDDIFGDLMQISIAGEEKAIAAARLDEKYKTYQAKLSRQLQKQYENTRKLEQELLQALITSRELEAPKQ